MFWGVFGGDFNVGKGRWLVGVCMVVMGCDSTCGHVQKQSLVLAATGPPRVVEEVGMSSQNVQLLGDLKAWWLEGHMD